MKKLAIAVFALSACGDPRINFVGQYKGNAIQTFSFGDGSVHSITSDLSFSIAAPANNNKLQFSNKCMLTAEPIDSESLMVDSTTCPTERLKTVGGSWADFTDDIRTGTGTINNKSLSITLRGIQTGSNYSNGSQTEQFPFELKMTLFKQ